MQLPHDLIGSGPRKVMVLHGWLGDSTSFGPIRPYLDTETFGYAFVDYRGYGEARDTPGEYTVGEAAQDVLDTAEALGWDRFSLIGHSMGGMVAQHVLLAAAERVEALVGISPVPASGVPFDEQGWQLFSGAAEAPEQRRAIIDLTTGNRLPAAWLDAMVDRSVGRTDKAAFRRYLDSWSGTDIHDRVEGSTTPVLVLAGAHDPALSPEVMKDTWLQWYSRAELEVFTDAGHYAPDEVPLALVSHCEGFLRR
ncbi:pimeloyl-ACP methyl ester carboxylesterase [Halopolyspora algeriensis]|uniref:Pimeloyl-ACP methyl ester carboxylesterase n=1 Tax=Halopolyspora algeriensis TaxID=1500506 RepID=A0A368VM98_9ACTN|nr:alpha/beta hydrolase [Halopolyspora algeriensis]RCW42841.1 pimeloyl-ACP methyl ester carboxylesterase [Halopolyspora algeriensis]TQM56689.1 pimeloyl-ACP methyl ester carboxylesterase [Halopolyspora algeriensis]